MTTGSVQEIDGNAEHPHSFWIPVMLELRWVRRELEGAVYHQTPPTQLVLQFRPSGGPWKDIPVEVE